tara:strand:- start:4357 stop:4563 length:207 start_codon:yes stop_codon:yes gene_type:complete
MGRLSRGRDWKSLGGICVIITQKNCTETVPTVRFGLGARTDCYYPPGGHLPEVGFGKERCPTVKIPSL